MEVILQRLSEHLAPSQQYVDQCKKTADKLFRLLQSRSRYKLDRCRVVGGLGKKTSTVVKVDADLVVFVNENPGNVLKTKDNILSDWMDVILMNTDLTEDKIRQTKFSLKISYNNVAVDLLPAINFSSDRCPFQQQKLAMEFIKKSGNPVETSGYLSAELTELSLEFMKTKSKFCHDLARLAKYWSQTILFHEGVSGKSTMMEMLGVKAAQEEETKNPKSPSYKAALEAFFRKVKDMYEGRGQLIFDDYYRVKDVPGNIRNQHPLILYPTNPYNNILSTKDGPKAKQEILKRFLKMFAECANNSLGHLSQEPSRLFYPQPMMFKIPAIKFYANTRMLLLYEKYHDPMPNIVTRREFSPEMKSSLHGLLNVYMAAQEYSEAMEPHLSLDEHREKLKKLVDGMTNNNLIWVARTGERHEDRAVTLMLPFKTGGRLQGWAMFHSFDVTMM